MLFYSLSLDFWKLKPPRSFENHRWLLFLFLNLLKSIQHLNIFLSVHISKDVHGKCCGLWICVSTPAPVELYAEFSLICALKRSVFTDVTPSACSGLKKLHALKNCSCSHHPCRSIVPPRSPYGPFRIIFCTRWCGLLLHEKHLWFHHSTFLICLPLLSCFSAPSFRLICCRDFRKTTTLEGRWKQFWG